MTDATLLLACQWWFTLLQLSALVVLGSTCTARKYLAVSRG